MATHEQKKALWATIRQEHPEFGRRLQQAKGENGEFIEIEGYPKRTTQWINAAIEEHAPELAEHIATVLIPAKRKMNMFSPRITVELDILILALINHEARPPVLARKAG